MQSFKQHLFESRWLASSDLQDRVRKSIHANIMNMPSFDPYVTVDSRRITLDNDGIESILSVLIERLTNDLQQIIRDVFKEKYPQIDEKHITFNAIVDTDDAGTKGRASEVPGNRHLIELELNIAHSIDDMLRAVAKRKDSEGSWDITFKKFLLRHVIDSWTKTVVHECTHLAQMMSIRVDNYELYMKKFLPINYSNPKLRDKQRQHNDVAYLGSTAEIQAHAASVAQIMVKQMGAEKTAWMIDEFEKWVYDQDGLKFKAPRKISRFDLVMRKMFGIGGGPDSETVNKLRSVEKIFNKSPKGIVKLLDRYEELQSYATLYLMGAADRRIISRFIRDMRRTVTDKTGVVFMKDRK